MTHTPDDLRRGLRSIAADAPPFDAAAALRRMTEAPTASDPDPVGAEDQAEVEAASGEVTAVSEVETLTARRALRPRRRVAPWLMGAAAAASLVAVVLPGMLGDGVESRNDPVNAAAPVASESAVPGQALLGEGTRPAEGGPARTPTGETQTYLIPRPQTVQGVPATPRPPDVRIVGTLVDVGRRCVALKQPDGSVVPVVWPAGTRPLPTMEGLAVVAPDGRTLGANESGPEPVLLDGRFVPSPPGLCSAELSARAFQVRVMSDGTALPAPAPSR